MSRVVRVLVITAIVVSSLATWILGTVLAMGLHVYSDANQFLPWVLLGTTAITVGSALKTVFQMILED